MNQLLDQLRAKDPETYKRIRRGLPLKPRGQYIAYDNGEVRALQYEEVYIPLDELLPEVACAWLQAVLQEAISSRGWASTLTYNPPDGPEAPHWSAHIWPDEHCQMSHKADSPAEALLAAYVEAMSK